MVWLSQTGIHHHNPHSLLRDTIGLSVSPLQVGSTHKINEPDSQVKPVSIPVKIQYLLGENRLLIFHSHCIRMEAPCLYNSLGQQ